jgi:hypothetical protein
VGDVRSTDSSAGCNYSMNNTPSIHTDHEWKRQTGSAFRAIAESQKSYPTLRNVKRRDGFVAGRSFQMFGRWALTVDSGLPTMGTEMG